MARLSSIDRAHIGPEGYSESTMLPPLDELEGMEVYDINGDRVGKVSHVYTDSIAGHVRYLAIATGWFGMRHHTVPVDDVRTEIDGDDAFLMLPYDEDTLKEGPSYDPDDDASLTRGEETRIYGYYGRDAYWDAVRARQTAPAPTPEIAEAEVQAAIDRGEDPSVVAVRRWGV
jgi:sporulation protein YlmC with PRC-barrel domain